MFNKILIHGLFVMLIPGQMDYRYGPSYGFHCECRQPAPSPCRWQSGPCQIHCHKCQVYSAGEQLNNNFDHGIIIYPTDHGIIIYPTDHGIIVYPAVLSYTLFIFLIF